MNRMLKGWIILRAMAVGMVMLALVSAGCNIQKTEPLHTGSVYVTLSSGDTLIPGARIRVDGQQTTRFTPAFIGGLSAGSHRVSAFKPGLVDTAMSASVSYNGIDTVALSTIPASDGAIDLVGAPSGTVLLVDNMPYDTVPVSTDNPTLFPNIGLGTFVVSAYLPGHTTELPAKWTVQITPGNTVSLSPVFVAADTGSVAGDLAAPFELRSDWGNSTYGIQDFRGQVCLVTFFFYNCSGCIEEFPYIAATYDDPRYAGKVQFIGVDFTDPYWKFAQFRNDHDALGITFPLVHDPQQVAKTAYNVTSMPSNFIVDATGRIRLVQGGVSEATLRNSLDDALQTANSATFSFTMRDTVLDYGTVDSLRFGSFEFFGTTTNLLNAPRNFIYTVTAADTNRYHSTCVHGNCFVQVAGMDVHVAAYQPSEVDTGVGVILYNEVNVLQDSAYVPVNDTLHGDYYLNVSVAPTDNSTETVSYRLHLHDVAASSPLGNPFLPRERLSLLQHPTTR